MKTNATAMLAGAERKAKSLDAALMALRVIHTWATYDDGSALDPRDVARLCAKVLDMGRPPPGTLDRPRHVCAVCGEPIDANEAFITRPVSWNRRPEHVHLTCIDQALAKREKS